MKVHRTMTVDKEWLTDRGACSFAREQLAQFMPAKISTDPEKNIALALENNGMRLCRLRPS
jgi:hypothetical protein